MFTGVGCHFLLQCTKMKGKSLSHVRLFVTPWTAAHQAPPPMGFSRQEYWSGLLLPSPSLFYILDSTYKWFKQYLSFSVCLVSLSIIFSMCAKLLQSYLTLWDPMDHGPPGSSVHGILQARILVWVAMPASRGSSQLRDRTCVSYVYLHWQESSLPLVLPGKP